MPFIKGQGKKGKSEDKKAEASKEPVVSTSPIHKAFYIEKSAGSWKLVVADIQDDKVIGKKTKECDNKALSLENFKIQFSKHYYFGQ